MMVCIMITFDWSDKLTILVDGQPWKSYDPYIEHGRYVICPSSDRFEQIILARFFVDMRTSRALIFWSICDCNTIRRWEIEITHMNVFAYTWPKIQMKLPTRRDEMWFDSFMSDPYRRELAKVGKPHIENPIVKIDWTRINDVIVASGYGIEIRINCVNDLTVSFIANRPWNVLGMIVMQIKDALQYMMHCYDYTFNVINETELRVIFNAEYNTRKGTEAFIQHLTEWPLELNAYEDESMD